jgi:uncharacterized protein YecT (DUF1311 family)
MKLGFLSALGIVVVASPVSVHALDCTKASTPVDKLFCATPKLKNADAAMSAAYFKLLRETKNPDFHEALIRSQRRWLKQRSEGSPKFGAAEDDDNLDDGEILLKMTRDRLNFLKGNEPIRTMEEQQKVVSNDSGGPFAGYETSCSFLPPPYGNWTYACWSVAHRQHRDRVCSDENEWATGHMTEYRLVSTVKDGEPKPVANCSIGYAETDEQCPEPDDDAETKARAHWNTNPLSSRYLPTPHAGRLSKYDPDAGPKAAGDPWMHDCLFAPTYPPQELSRPSSAPKN